MPRVLRVIPLLLLAFLGACGAPGTRPATPEAFAADRALAQAQRAAVQDDRCANGGVLHSYGVRLSTLQGGRTTGVESQELSVCLPPDVLPPPLSVVLTAFMNRGDQQGGYAPRYRGYGYDNWNSCPGYFGPLPGRCWFPREMKWWWPREW